MPRNVIKLFIDTNDSASQAGVELDPEEMKVCRPEILVMCEVCELKEKYTLHLYRRNFLYRSAR